MSDETPDVKEHVTSSSTWIRLVYLILYGIAYRVASLVLLVISVLQFLKTLFTGTPFPQLQLFGGSLADYNRELVAFLSFESDVRPFPVGPWPDQKTPPPASPPQEEEKEEVIIIAEDPTPKKPRTRRPTKKPEDDGGSASTA